VRSPDTRPWKQALAWLAALAPFFFLSYRFANWVTGLRHNVPSLVFGWEHSIPFLPWTVLPYWSTDVLYAVSLFICPTLQELHTHAKRLLAAQVISVAAFLLFPLRFSFQVPHTEGVFGWLFAALYDFDKPFNQAPSLHLSLTVLLWAEYSRQLRGLLLWLMRGWMVLVGISTLTTYQHHFIDLPTGIWVGLLCIALFPFDKPAMHAAPSRDRKRFPIAARYLTGAMMASLPAVWIGGAAWLLLWPGGALLLVALIYASGRPEYFRKANGRMPAPVICLLGPYLIGAYLNHLWWARRETASDEIVTGIWLGRLQRPAERDRIHSMVDVTAELPVDIAGIRYCPVPMLDRLAPEVSQLNAAVEAIDDLEGERPTLVCCAVGYSRSAAAVAAWLMASGRAASVDESIAQIQAWRPRIVLGSADRARLEEWRQSNLKR
jgi:membrane-associated phospholipid phosphatase